VLRILKKFQKVNLRSSEHREEREQAQAGKFALGTEWAGDPLLWVPHLLVMTSGYLSCLTNNPASDRAFDWQPLTPKSRSVTVQPPDTGGPSLLLVASALLFFVGVLLSAVVRRWM
jgi:hypothetical protein